MLLADRSVVEWEFSQVRSTFGENYFYEVEGKLRAFDGFRSNVPRNLKIFKFLRRSSLFDIVTIVCGVLCNLVDFVGQSVFKVRLVQ